MPEIPRARLLAYVVAALVVAVVGLWALRGEERGTSSGRPTASGVGETGGNGGAGTRRGADDGDAGSGGGASSGVSVEGPPAASPVVHVAGAVRRAGVYRVPDGSRVEDAVRRAGGAAPDANLDGINLAAKVADGQQIVVPGTVAAAPAGGAGADGGQREGSEGSAPAAPVGLNAATLEQLQTLDGVGPATAEKIVAWRTEHGGFRSVDDLGQVPGIGPKRLAALRDHVQP